MTLSDSERLIRIETLLQERCSFCHKAQEDHESRLGALEELEQRRKGGFAALTALCTVAGAVGALVVKFLPFGR